MADALAKQIAANGDRLSTGFLGSYNLCPALSMYGKDKTAYNLLVHPISHDIYVLDATNYVSSGKLYCFDRNGKFKWTTWTGDIPGHAA